MENLITIKLFGRSYTFKTETDVSKAQAVGDSLVDEVKRIQEQEADNSSEMTKFTMLMLAALNMANENYELKNKYSELINNLYDRSIQLSKLIDHGLKKLK